MDKPELYSDEDLTRRTARVQHLEKENQWYFSALDLVASLGEIHRSFKQQEDPAGVFREAQPLISRIMPLDTAALYLVDPANSAFKLDWCTPPENGCRVEDQVADWIETGTFAWALQQNRPLPIAGADRKNHWFLHPLATRASVLGMVVGRLPDSAASLRPETCKVLSIILQNIAQAMENARLYQEIQNQNRNLEQLVQSRTRNLENQTLELKLRVQEIQEFTYLASHDLREPLRELMAFCNRLKSLSLHGLDKQALEYLGAMERAAGRMDVLVDGLLNLSRISTHGSPRQPTNLNAILQAALDDLGHVIEKTGARIDKEPLPTLAIDPGQFHQVFRHVIDNALKFQLPGQTPLLRIGARRLPEGVWEIRVKDNGIGIDPAHRKTIFKPFKRLHRQEDYEGAGLGLAICTKIMERHHGDLRVESRLGQGACFLLTLPESA